MRQEAGNLSSGAISPSFDLGREHTEEASGADPTRGEAPAGGMKPNTRPVATGQWVVRGELAVPEPRTPLPAGDHVHLQGSSPRLALASPGRWACAACPALGMSWGAGAVSVPPRGGWRGVEPPPLPAAPGGAGAPRAPLATPVPLAQGRDSVCGTGLVRHGHGGRGQRLESDQGHGYLGVPRFFVPHPSDASLGREKD